MRITVFSESIIMLGSFRNRCRMRTGGSVPANFRLLFDVLCFIGDLRSAAKGLLRGMKSFFQKFMIFLSRKCKLL